MASEELLVSGTDTSKLLTKQDSGYSTLPDDSAKQYYYNHIAPKNQTSYKLMYNVSKPVTKTIQEQKQIRAFASNTMAIGSAVSGIGVTVKNARAMTIGTVTQGAGGVLYLISDYVIKSLEKIKKNTKFRCKLYFKWDNASKLEYSVKVRYYYEYKGKRVSSIDTIERRFTL